MTDARGEAVASVDSVLVELKALGDPGPKWREDNGGWTTESRDHWLKSFADIRERLLSGDTDFEGPAHHLIRWMDHDGVVGGPIAEEAAKLQGHLYDLWVGDA